MSEPLKFERISIDSENQARLPLFRAKAPGGWILRSIDNASGSLLFIPDPKHEWDIAMMPKD